MTIEINIVDTLSNICFASCVKPSPISASSSGAGLARANRECGASWEGCKTFNGCSASYNKEGSLGDEAGVSVNLEVLMLTLTPHEPVTHKRAEDPN